MVIKSPLNLDNFETIFKENLKPCLSRFKDQLNRIRTGRAQPQAIDYLTVNYYDRLVPIREMATIHVQNANELVVKPFGGETDYVKAIANAISAAHLGFNVIKETAYLIVKIPPLTGERRKELIKKVDEVAEEAIIDMRQVRQAVLKKIKADNDDFTKDDVHQSQIRVDEIYDQFKDELDKMVATKKTELETI